MRVCDKNCSESFRLIGNSRFIGTAVRPSTSSTVAAPVVAVVAPVVAVAPVAFNKVSFMDDIDVSSLIVERSMENLNLEVSNWSIPSRILGSETFVVEASTVVDSDVLTDPKNAPKGTVT